MCGSISYKEHTRHACQLVRLQSSREFRVHLYNIVVKQQPVAMTLDDGDVVSSVGATEKERAEHDD